MLTSKKSFLFAAALALASARAQTLDRQYQDVAGRLVGAALTDEGGFEKLTWLCDRIGARLGGSKALEEAVRWSAAEMRREGLANVATPKVMVPHWVRGAESAKILAPIARPLTMLGLGNSIGTPKEGITAEVVAVRSFDELKAVASRSTNIEFMKTCCGTGHTLKRQASHLLGPQHFQRFLAQNTRAGRPAGDVGDHGGQHHGHQNRWRVELPFALEELHQHQIGEAAGEQAAH